MKAIVPGLVVACLLAAGTPASAQDKLVVTAFGGVWRESIEKNFASCFKQRTGKDVAIQTGESADWLNRIKANPSSPPIHVVTLAQSDTTRGIREGLFEKITAEKVPNLKEMPDRFYKGWDAQAVDVHVGGLGVVYNKDIIKEPPKSWKELFDAIAAGKFGKKVSMPAGTYTWGPDFLWFIAQQYDGNIDTAFAKMKAMQPYVAKFWTTPVDALNLFAAKDVDLMVYWDGRAWAFIDDGNKWANFYLPEPNALGATLGFSKTKGSPDYAWAYIDCAISPDVQLGHLKTLRYAVTNPNVTIPDDLKGKISPVDKLVWPNYPEYIDKFAGWVERWNKEMR
jgi:putative spermidine/putrescine transport system substrate-binding protein